MHKDVRRDMSQGLADLKKGLPLLQQHCPEFGAGLCTFVSEYPGTIAGDLDALSGFDAYQRWQGGMRGIAGRAQRGRVRRTFTIQTGRATGMDTEYRKRVHAIRHRTEGLMYPYWHAHAYLSDDGSQVQAIGLVKTEELFSWVYQREKAGYVFQRIPAGRETFLAVSWDFYKHSGLYFFEYVAVAEKALVS